MFCNMKKLGTHICSAVAVFVLSANAQINLQSAVINFRTNTSTDKGNTTTHYGKLNVDGRTTALTVTCNQSNTSSQNYAIKASATNSTGTYSANIGGRFSATGGSQLNYGVWGIASGAIQNNWAGYFEGNTWCTNGVWQGSDEKLKKDVEPIRSATDKIMQLQPKSFYFDTTKYPKMNLSPKKQFGLLAQELEKIFPDMVTEVTEPDTSSDSNKDPEKFKAVNYTQLIAVLIAAIQEQQKEIEALKTALGR